MIRKIIIMEDEPPPSGLDLEPAVAETHEPFIGLSPVAVALPIWRLSEMIEKWRR